MTNDLFLVTYPHIGFRPELRSERKRRMRAYHLPGVPTREQSALTLRFSNIGTVKDAALRLGRLAAIAAEDATGAGDYAHTTQERT